MFGYAGGGLEHGDGRGGPEPSFGIPFGSGVPSRRSHCEVPSGAGRRKLGQRDWRAEERLVAAGSSWEASLVGSSGSNCRVERSIQSAQDHVREMRVSLQDRWKVDASHRHAVFSWMLEYEAYLLNWCEVGRDRTACERGKAKKAKPLPTEFGELVQWRRNLQGEDRQEEVDRGRWKPKAMLVTGVPWRMSEDDDKADREPFSKLKVLEETIRKHDVDVERGRDSPRVNTKKLLHHKEGHGAAWVLGEVLAPDEIREKSQGHREVQEGRGDVRAARGEGVGTTR